MQNHYTSWRIDESSEKLILDYGLWITWPRLDYRMFYLLAMRPQSSHLTSLNFRFPIILGYHLTKVFDKIKKTRYKNAYHSAWYTLSTNETTENIPQNDFPRVSLWKLLRAHGMRYQRARNSGDRRQGRTASGPP